MLPAGGAVFIGKPLLDALEAMGYGGLLLDGTGTVLAANTAAVRLLDEHARAENGGTDRYRAVLDRLLRHGSGDVLGPDEEGWVAVARDGAERPLVVRSVPFGNGSAHGPRRALVLVDLDACPNLSAEALKRLFGLTPSEARLAIEMACGKGPDEVADAAGVSVATVRKQLAAVFAKTGTCRQGELVALLTRLAILP